jgi:two-component system chemotaxis response regulator CheY
MRRSGVGAGEMRGRAKTILLVEDHPQQRNAMRTLLQRMGFETVEASDAASAIQRLAACSPDVICVDLVLPESSGYDLCEFIRRSPEHRKTPILMMSDRAYPEDRAHAAEVGANAFIAKPFSPERLRAWIDALLRGAQATPVPADP